MGTLPQAFFFFKKKIWKPLTCGYDAAGVLFFHKESPIFLEAPTLWARCCRCLFFGKKGLHIFTSPELLGTLPQAPFFFGKKWPHISGHGSTRSGHGSSGHGTEIFGTARIIRARHGNPPPPVKGGTGVFLTRHGTSIFGTARDHEGTARKYLARHGSTRSGHGTARDVPDLAAALASGRRGALRTPV